MAASKLSGKTCLVTGASGFIGLRLCDELVKNGAIVKALLNNPAVGSWSSSYTCKLGEQDIPEIVLNDVDIIFHLAGRSHALEDTSQQTKLYFKTNVEGTRSLLNAAKHAEVRSFIYFSSVKAMGEECDLRLDENCSPQPVSAYGQSKLEAEKLVLDGGFVDSPTVLRLVMVYGDSNKGNFPRLIKAISKNWFPPLPRIENKRSMIHVDDVIEYAMLVACNYKCSGETYILCDGNDYSTRKLYELIRKSLGKSIPKWGMPLVFFKFIAKLGDLYKIIVGSRFMFDSDQLQKLIGNSFYSSKKINTDLNYKPRHSLFETLPKIISSVLNR